MSKKQPISADHFSQVGKMVEIGSSAEEVGRRQP
jgi:hypothetical protein